MRVILLKDESRLEMDNVKSVIYNGQYVLVETGFTLNTLLLAAANMALDIFDYRVVRASRESTEIEFECETCSVYE